MIREYEERLADKLQEIKSLQQDLAKERLSKADNTEATMLR